MGDVDSTYKSVLGTIFKNRKLRVESEHNAARSLFQKGSFAALSEYGELDGSPFLLIANLSTPILT